MRAFNSVEEVKFCGRCSVLWRMLSTVGDTINTVGDSVLDQCCGGYSVLQRENTSTVLLHSTEYPPQYYTDVRKVADMQNFR